LFQAKFDTLIAETAVLGGAILGCGGGGKLEVGLQLGQYVAEADPPALVPLSDLPPQANLVAISAFHTSAIDTFFGTPCPGAHALTLLRQHTRGPVEGLFNAGHGAVDTIIGWATAAPANLPLVDSGLQVTLHPDPLMNLLAALSGNRHSYTMAVVSVEKTATQQLEQLYYGPAGQLEDALNQLATQVSGTFLVALGPVSYHWLAANGRPEFISTALNTGAAMLKADAQGSPGATTAVCQVLDGRRLIFGTVTDIQYQAEGRAAQVLFTLRDESNRLITLKQWHRYVSLTIEDEQVAAFPDQIVTLGSMGTPLAGEEISKGHEIYIIVAQGSKPSEVSPHFTVRK
jgi:DUF917 family protein